MVNPAILLMALLDGLNICALTLLALFVSLMFMYNVGRRVVVVLGLAYVAGVFASYFATGLGLSLLAISLPAVPHFLTRVGAGAMVFFGAANVVNYFRPGTVPMMLPSALGKAAVGRMKSLSTGASFPAVLFIGALVGLHNFPCACTGGIYVTFIGLVSGSPLFIPYLLAYNALFVVPLLTVLAVCSSKPVTVKFRLWHETNEDKFRLALGSVMAAMGIVLLILASMGWL